MTRVEALQAAADLALPYAVTTAHGTVRIGKVTSDGDHVDVWLTGAPPDGEPSYRIVNPPLLAEDLAAPTGYREDPMLALAQVLAANGGASRR